MREVEGFWRKVGGGWQASKAACQFAIPLSMPQARTDLVYYPLLSLARCCRLPVLLSYHVLPELHHELVPLYSAIDVSHHFTLGF